ncbi:MAG: hypothetical protein AAF394_13855, partial [Planctomycetota bacterium]
MKAAEQKKLLPHLGRTIEALEEIMGVGLSTASGSTSKTLAVTFQEAARLKLLRLGSTLRGTNDEINRYLKDDPKFSQTRLLFFLNRSWLLCQGLQQAIKQKDTKRLQNLLWSPNSEPVKKLR